LVTGASRGIGAGIAQRLAAEGAAVAVTARTAESHPTLPGSLKQTVEVIGAAGGRAIAITADLADPEDRQRIVPEAVAQLGAIDVLVNNAAACFFMPFEAYSANRLRIALEINVRAPFELVQQVLPAMREKGCGWIVNIGSATSKHKTFPFDDPYAKHPDLVYGLSKAALDRFSNGLAAEVIDDGIACNLVMPRGGVITPGVEAIGTALTDEMTEPLEAMVEATLAACVCDPKQLNGRITDSLTLLSELERPVRTLDGSARYAG
jgi:NAD(P)-dependent dehydrogenase (short-subunit alcohol dehydrogenase family)